MFNLCTVLFKLSLSNVPRRPLLYKRSHALLSVSCRNELRDRKTFSQTKHTKYCHIVQIWFIWFMYNTHPGVTHSLNSHSWRDVHLRASIHGYFGHSYSDRGLERQENIRKKSFFLLKIRLDFHFLKEMRVACPYKTQWHNTKMFWVVAKELLRCSG